MISDPKETIACSKKFSASLKLPYDCLAIKSNSYKIEGLLNDVGLSNRLIRNEENILNEVKLKSHLSEKQKIKIDNYLNDTRIKINNLFFEIANL